MGWSSDVCSSDLHFVAVGCQTLCDSKPGFDRPYIDQLQRRRLASTLERTTQGLAVYRHHPVQFLGKLGHEPAKDRLKRLRIKKTEHQIGRVMGSECRAQASRTAA